MNKDDRAFNLLYGLGTITTKYFKLKRNILVISANHIQIDSPESKSFLKNIEEGQPIKLLDQMIDRKFDLILGDLPFGMSYINWIYSPENINIFEKTNWIVLYKSLFNLSDNGYGIYFVEPSFIINTKLISELNKHGFYINAILNSPNKILNPETSLRPLIVFISKRNNIDLFIAELEFDSDSTLIMDNFYNNNSKNLQEGLFIKKEEFNGFEKYKVFNQLEKLTQQYKEFKSYTISEIAIEINLGKELVPKENCIYIPKIGTSKVINNLDLSKIKQQNLIQVVLDNNIVNSRYLTLFFNSKIGKLNLQMLYSGFIPHISKMAIGELTVSIPPIDLQNKIVNTSEKIEKLLLKITDFEQEIAVNPKSVEKLESELNSMLGSINMLNESDKIMSLIREGESKVVEFKETMCKDVRTNQKNKEMEKMILKTVLAFFNTEGGTLLIGVDDKGIITGIENDFYESNDNYLKHFHNLIRDQIGEPFFPLIDYNICLVDNKKVLRIDCKKSKKEVFLKGDDGIYIRSNPATDKLTGQKLIEYIKNHFI